MGSDALSRTAPQSCCEDHTGDDDCEADRSREKQRLSAAGRGDLFEAERAPCGFDQGTAGLEALLRLFREGLRDDSVDANRQPRPSFARARWLLLEVCPGNGESGAARKDGLAGPLATARRGLLRSGPNRRPDATVAT